MRFLTNTNQNNTNVILNKLHLFEYEPWPTFVSDFKYRLCFSSKLNAYLSALKSKHQRINFSRFIITQIFPEFALLQVDVQQSMINNRLCYYIIVISSSCIFNDYYLSGNAGREVPPPPNRNIVCRKTFQGCMEWNISYKIS